VHGTLFRTGDIVGPRTGRVKTVSAAGRYDVAAHRGWPLPGWCHGWP